MYVFQDSVIKKYGQNPRGYQFDRNICLDSMIEYSSNDSNAYSSVKYNFLKWLDFGDSMNFLHYRLQELDESYFMNSSMISSFDETVDLLSNILPETKWQRFWKPKPLIEKVLYILAGVSIISGFIFGLINFLWDYVIPLFN